MGFGCEAQSNISLRPSRQRLGQVSWMVGGLVPYMGVSIVMGVTPKMVGL